MMPCYRMKMPNGGVAMVCGKLGPHCSCGSVATALCDYPVGNGKTCDRRLCQECGHHVGPDTDYCHDHYAEWKKFEASGGVREMLQNVLPFPGRHEMSDLRLAVKQKYFDAIRNGEKIYEYRKVNEYWKKRLCGRHYDTVTITAGYPRKGDREREMTFPFVGQLVQFIRHELFGEEEIPVFAIPVGHHPAIVGARA